MIWGLEHYYIYYMTVVHICRSVSTCFPGQCSVYSRILKLGGNISFLGEQMY